MNALNLPEPIAAYFAADPQNPAAVAHCFTPQAVVKDEGRTHTGLEAIRQWKAASAAKYRYTAEPFAVVQNNQHHIVSGHVVGDFPGSPVNLRFQFRLERGLIAALEITA
ncbi:MAG: nuclear transport factor 2 family protein [Rubrivivax sp.]|nr:nuclear transport factor 2 family protein [Rubrivivax sp.]